MVDCLFIHCCSCRFSISYIICLSFFLESSSSVTNDCIQFLLTFYAVWQLFQNWACLLFVPFNKRKIQLILDKTKIPMSLVIVEFIFCSSAMSEIFSPFCQEQSCHFLESIWLWQSWQRRHKHKVGYILSSYDPNCSQNPYCSSVRCVVVDVCSLCNRNCGLCRIAAPKIHVRKSVQSSLVNLKFHIIDIVLNSIVTRTVDPSSANAVSYLLQCYVTKAKVGTLPPTGLTVFQT